MAAQSQRSEKVAPGTTIAGRYRVVRHLASGGMGAVYEVVHELTGRHHALKLLYESLVYDSVVLARFTQEARAATSIRSPHVVEVTDMGTEGTAPYLVMELLEGEDLGSRIAHAGSLDPTEAVDIIGQACDALTAAHAIGIIHRDLKPENLFLLDGDFVKVLDFGIAKLRRAHDAVGDGLTRDGNLVGTPEYMSPEQITVKSHLDHRTDVYSLGVILYEMLAGRLPFEAEQLTELAVMIVTTDPPPLSTRAFELPPGLDLVVHDAMARSAGDRPSDCRELARRLAPFGTPEVFAWVGDSMDLDPVRGDPSMRISRTTPRFAPRPRRPRPIETPEESAKRETPTLDVPSDRPPADVPIDAAVRSAPPPRARPAWLAPALGGAALLAIGGGIALAVTFGGGGEAPTRAAGAAVHAATPRETPPPIDAPSSPPIEAADAQSDAGIDDASAETSATDAGARARTTPRGPRGPHGGNGGGVRPAGTTQVDDDSSEAPAPHHAPLKTNPFI